MIFMNSFWCLLKNFITLKWSNFLTPTYNTRSNSMRGFVVRWLCFILVMLFSGGQWNKAETRTKLNAGPLYTRRLRNFTLFYLVYIFWKYHESVLLFPEKFLFFDLFGHISICDGLNQLNPNKVIGSDTFNLAELFGWCLKHTL